MQSNHSDGITAKASEPAGELAERVEFDRAGIEVRLYQNGDSFTLWLVELLDDEGADLHLQGDYPARIWQDQAEAIARADFERLAEQAREIDRAGCLTIFDDEDRVNVANWAGVHPDDLPPL